jgi:hypothetical protein
VSEILVTAAFFVLRLGFDIPLETVIPVCIGAAVGAPLLFFHHARSVWTAGVYLFSRIDWMK